MYGIGSLGNHKFLWKLSDLNNHSNLLELG